MISSLCYSTTLSWEGGASKGGVGLALGSHESHFRVRHRNALNELSSTAGVVAMIVLLTDFDSVISLSLCLSYKYADGENKNP